MLLRNSRESMAELSEVFITKKSWNWLYGTPVFCSLVYGEPKMHSMGRWLV